MSLKLIFLTVIIGLASLVAHKNISSNNVDEDKSLTELQKWYESSFEEIEDVADQLSKYKCDEVLLNEDAVKSRGEECSEIIKNHPISKLCDTFPKTRTSAGMTLYLFLCGNESDYNKHTEK